MICKNCKYHYIEEISFDYPQSCCRKASGTTEQWYKCNNFEYGDRYVEQLQQENKELHNKIDKAIEYLKDRIRVLEVSYSYDKNDEYLNAKLFGGKKELEMLLNEVLKDSDVDDNG